MPRSDRDIFDDHVIALTRQLGVQPERVSDSGRQRLLDDGRRRRLNEHEAALALAYGYAGEMLDDDLERARVLADRLALVGRQWLNERLVHESVRAPLERELRSALRERED
jgi:hypothetical protein